MDQDEPKSGDIISDYYEGYREMQAEIFRRASRKTRNSIFVIAAIIFLSDMLGLAIANLFTPETFLFILVVPAILTGVGLLARKQPLASSIIAIVIVAGIFIFTIVKYGGMGVIRGALVKVVIIYYLLAGIQSAKTAEKAKKELGE
jgi:hypothetical protein